MWQDNLQPSIPFYPPGQFGVPYYPRLNQYVNVYDAHSPPHIYTPQQYVQPYRTSPPPKSFPPEKQSPTNDHPKEYTFLLETGKGYPKGSLTNSTHPDNVDFNIPFPVKSTASAATSPIKVEEQEKEPARLRKYQRLHPNCSGPNCMVKNCEKRRNKQITAPTTTTTTATTTTTTTTKKQQKSKKGATHHGAQFLHLPIKEAADLFKTTPFFMGAFGTHGQEVHIAAIPCSQVDCTDRYWPNPRKNGTKIYELDPEFIDNYPSYCRKRICLWRERVFCKGKYDCEKNSNATDLKHRNCSVEIVCTIWADKPDIMEVKFMGDHGSKHKPPPISKDPLSYEVDEWIKEQMKISPHITPTQLHIAMTTTMRQKFSNTPIIPTLQKIINRVSYLRRRGNINKTDCEILCQLLRDPEVSDFILYPKLEKDFPSPEKDEWFIVFADKVMLETLDKHGRGVCGLDSCFKFTKYRMPFWAIVAEDSHHNAAPGAFILANRERAKTLAAALRVTATHIPGEPWNPNWTLDKDNKEHKAITEYCKDLFTKEIMLCHFHAMRTWKKQLMSKVSDPRLRLQVMWRIFHIQRATTLVAAVGRTILLRKYCLRWPELAEFSRYFDEHWVNTRWRTAWLDVYRQDRWGLLNTNNMSETTFRKLGKLFFQNKLRMTISRLVMCLTKVVIPYYNEISKQKQEGRIPIKPSHQERTEVNQKECAKSLFDDGYVTHHKCTCPHPEKCRCGRHDDLYSCQSQRSPTMCYWINLYCRTCTCMYYLSSGRVCKHIYAAILHKEESNPESMSTLDNAVDVDLPLELAEPTTSVTTTSTTTETESVVQQSVLMPPTSLDKMFNDQLVTHFAQEMHAIKDGTGNLTSFSALLQNIILQAAPQLTNQATAPPPAKSKTPFSPEHTGRPQSVVAPTFDFSKQFKAHRKRGPKSSQTLDGVNRRAPDPPRNYDNVVSIVGNKGIKNKYLAVKWKDLPDSHNTWEPESAILSIPRLQSLYKIYVESKALAAKARRQKYYQKTKETKQQAQGAPATEAPTPSIAPAPSSAPAPDPSSAPTPALSSAPAPALSSTPLVSASTLVPSAAPTPSVSPLMVQSEVLTLPAVPIEVLATPVLPTTPSTPIAQVRTKTASRTHRKKRKVSSSPKKPSKLLKIVSPPNTTIPSPNESQTTPERPPTMHVSNSSPPVCVPDDHPLLSKPYKLNRVLIAAMAKNTSIQLVPVTSLVKYVEHDRLYIAKDDRRDAASVVRQMQNSLNKDGVREEILLVYSLHDHKVVVCEGNTRIAACKRSKTITSLPARVIVVSNPTPDGVGMKVGELRYVGPYPATHYPPSAVGIPICDVSV